MVPGAWPLETRKQHIWILRKDFFCAAARLVAPAVRGLPHDPIRALSELGQHLILLDDVLVYVL